MPTSPAIPSPKSSFIAMASLLRRYPSLLACIFLATEFFNQYFLYMADALQESVAMDSSLIILNEVGALLSGAMTEGLLVLLIPAFLFSLKQEPELNGLQLVMQNLNPVFIESIRAMASVIRWGTLLLIPGLYKHLRYIFVPMIVLLDPEYRKGKIDALERSSQLCNGRFIWIVTLVTGFALVEYAVFSSHSNTLFTQNPAKWATVSLGRFFLDLFFYSYLYMIFFNANSITREEK